MKRRPFVWIVVGMIAVASSALIADRFASRAVDRAERERLRGQTALLAQWIGARGEDVDAQAAAQDAARVLLARVTLIDDSGVVHGDSSQGRSAVPDLDNHGNRPEILAARRGTTGESRRRSATTHVVYLYSARRMDGDGPLRYVRIAVRAPDNTAFRSSYIALIGGTVALAASLLAFGYSRHRRVSLAAGRIAQALESDSAAASSETGDGPEIVRLSRAIRLSSARQEERLRAIEGMQQVLAIAVEGLQEGLLVIDAERRIHLANRAAQRLFELDFDPVGGNVSQVVRNPALLDAIEHALTGDDEDVVHLALETSDRAFDIRVTPLKALDHGPAREALVLIVDVTRLRALERVREAFVADVSHEIRTPLTAIKAAVETILEDDRFRDEPFPQMIHRNAEAIEGLVEDLTDLSLIESGAVILDRSRFDLARLVRQTVEQLRPVAGEIPVRLQLDEPLWMVGDERRIRRVLVNLLDNAIKFIRAGGAIDVIGEQSGDVVRVRIRDEGIGIPSTELDKVFNRFHQVASDRSRQRPGHGLGLAIVKHLVRLHDGRVGVTSELGQGSTFTLELPAET